MKQKLKGSFQRGFSLTEILVVVAIIGLLSVVGAPNFINFYRAGKLKTSMRMMTSDLRFARQQAVTQSTRTKLSFTPGTREYNIFQLQGTLTWRLIRGPRLLDETVTIAATNFLTVDTDTDPDIMFGPSGTVQNVPPAASVTDQLGTLTLRSSFTNLPRSEYVIQFRPSGQLRVE